MANDRAISSENIRVAKLEVMMDDVRSNTKDIDNSIIALTERFEQKMEMIVKFINDREDRYNEKFATKQDLTNGLQSVREPLNTLWKGVYTIAGIISVAIIGGILKILFKP